MKTARKLLAVLLTLALVCSLGITALAAGTPTGSITLKDSTSVSVAGKTFSAYKVMDASFVDPNDLAKGISYTVPTELKDFYADRYTDLNKNTADFNEQVVIKIAAEPDPYAFATAVLAAAKEKVTAVTKTAGDGANKVVIDNLPFGYYVIEDTGTNSPVSALMLDTVGNIEITIKADKPTVDKKIDGANDTDPGSTGDVSMNNAAIGDKVPFKVTSKVPDMEGYSSYTFKITDTLSEGLTFNNDAAVTVNGVTQTGNYTVESTGGNGSATTVTITFNNFYTDFKGQAGQNIVITYSATLNEHAVHGVAGNTNSVKLTYSNNPNDSSKKETTPGVETKTFVTDLVLLKVDEAQNRLTGAKFKIVCDRLNKTVVSTNTYTESAEGAYYLLKTGEYTTTEPGHEIADNKYASTATKYTLSSSAVIETKTTIEAEVGGDGVLKLSGIPAGTYTITELVAPDGYNLLTTPVTVTVTCTNPGEVAGNATWTATGAAVEDGIVKVTVVNKSGTELPSTGGIGTTIFYVVGGGLMVAAVVLLITKKRMTDEK